MRRYDCALTIDFEKNAFTPGEDWEKMLKTSTLRSIDLPMIEINVRVDARTNVSSLHKWKKPDAQIADDNTVRRDCSRCSTCTFTCSHAQLAALASRWYSHGKQETDEEFDARWVTYFNKPDIDAWELRKGMNTLIGYDLVPEPKILDAALRACRRLNDLASAIRILEAVKEKSGPHKDIYPYTNYNIIPGSLLTVVQYDCT
ncbi:hypothetical protein scyTo_0003260 [Scyliorhinus torazame]|uniref:Cytochrome c oxidase subunit 5A, mitochondrial n=1 Tax=Scyliorhinus torazame TaxID=75743 RepID=A0A401PM35_SCYTO|nr:hypothetical protein [Scyliorhinus torazame]